VPSLAPTPHADAPVRLPLCVLHAGGGACTLFSGEGDRPGSLVLHPLGRAMTMEMLASCRAFSLPLPQGPRGPHVRYISTYRTPLILSGVPCWLADSIGHQLSSRRGKARTLRHGRLLFMRSSENYSAGVARLLCHTCAKCWNRAKNGNHSFRKKALIIFKNSAGRNVTAWILRRLMKTPPRPRQLTHNSQRPGIPQYTGSRTQHLHIYSMLRKLRPRGCRRQGFR